MQFSDFKIVNSMVKIIKRMLNKRKAKRLDRQIRKELDQPVRREIIELLENNESMHFGDILESIDAKHETVQKNLSDLKQAGIVRLKKNSAAYLLSYRYKKMIKEN